MKRNFVQLFCAGFLLACVCAISSNVYAVETELNQYYDDRVKFLLTQYGRLALHELVKSRQDKEKRDDDLEVARRLVLEHGIDIGLPDQNSDTVLIEAAGWGDLVMVKNLLSLGANVNQKGSYGRTALMKASEFGRVPIIKLLCEHGAQINLTTSSSFYYTTMMFAAQRSGSESYDAVKTLLSFGANVNYQAVESGVTALMVASRHGKVSMIKLLLEHGAQIDLADKLGNTALSSAADLDTASALLTLGADVNYQGNSGYTALMAASRGGNLPKVKLLLEHGAKVTLKDDEGQVAMSYAFDMPSGQKKKTEVITTLRAYDPEGYCFCYTQLQMFDLVEMLNKETGPLKNDNEEKIPFWIDLYNFVNTFDVTECSTQYRFAFIRMKENIGTFLTMYHEWKKGPLFSEVTAEDLNVQARAKISSWEKLFAIRAPY